MKILSEYIKEGFKITSKTKVDKYNYHPETGFELQKIVQKCIDTRGNDADLNDIDTSKVTNMSGLFMNRRFNGNISKWDVSNVKTMHKMFEGCPLEKNPPKWYKE